MRRYSLTARGLFLRSPARLWLRWPWWPARRRSSSTTTALSTPSRWCPARAVCLGALQFRSGRPVQRSGHAIHPGPWRTDRARHALCCKLGPSPPAEHETFALTWDRTYRGVLIGDRGYIEQFLQDVAKTADRSSSPFAVTSQYADNASLTPVPFLVTGRALNNSKYGGGCIDYGGRGGSLTGYRRGHQRQGHDYPGTDAMGRIATLRAERRRLRASPTAASRVR